MPKGLFTASVVVLFERAPALEAIERALRRAELTVRGPKAGQGDDPWIGGPSVLVEMRPEVHGLVSVDLVDRPWPDSMGHPQHEPQLFASWSFGAFGPFVFPGNLERAVAHALAWPEAATHVGRHAGFVRCRASYVLGLGEDAAVLPEGYDPLDELDFLARVARAVLAVDGAIAFFDPSGEVLLDRAGVEELLEGREPGEPPLDLYSNVRFFQIGDADGWAVMDTIGMEQLGVIDQEACFPVARVDPDAVASFLRSLTLYLLSEGPVIEHGHTVDGPGGVWRASAREQSLVPAPRAILRWIPTFVGAPPAGLE